MILNPIINNPQRTNLFLNIQVKRKKKIHKPLIYQWSKDRQEKFIVLEEDQEAEDQSQDLTSNKNIPVYFQTPLQIL